MTNVKTWRTLTPMQKPNENISLVESMDSIDRPSVWRAILLLWPYLKPHKFRIFIGLTAVAVAGMTMLAFGWGLKNLIDDGFASGGGEEALDRALVVLLGMIAVLALASATRLYMLTWLAENLVAGLRRDVFARLLTLDAAWFDRHRSGEWVSRLNSDTAVLQVVVSTSLPFILRNLVMMVGGVVMMFVVSPHMAAMMLIVVSMVVFPLAIAGRRVRLRSRRMQDNAAELGGMTQEAVQAITTIQSLGAERYTSGRFDVLAGNVFAAALRQAGVRAWMASFVIFFVFGAIGVVLWRGGLRVIEGSLSAGDLSAFVFYAVLVSAAVGVLTELIGAILQAIGAADRILSVLKATPAIRAPLNPKVLQRPLQGKIEFENVRFYYPSRPNVPALEDVSFTIKPGENIALVGPSGAGKSTVFALLQRFYDPQQGCVKVDGIDIRALDPQDLRAAFGVVAQDPVIFSSTVFENIALGCPDASFEAVQAAAHQAQADGFIKALPQAYNTPLGERGSRLSGGQRQRIALARAILRDPRILLLDEATSALDSRSEQAVQQALATLAEDRTTLVIAHRLATVRNAERILLFDQGRLVASGDHESLYNSHRLYKKLADLQFNSF